MRAVFPADRLRHLAKVRMMAIVLSSSGVPAGGLDMSERADPHASPGPRCRERLDAPQDLGLGQLRDIGGDACMGETLFGAFARNAWAGIRGVSQASRFRRLLRIENRLDIGD